MPYKCFNCGAIRQSANYPCSDVKACGFKTGRFKYTNESESDNSTPSIIDQLPVGCQVAVYGFIWYLFGAVVGAIVAIFTDAATGNLVGRSIWGIGICLALLGYALSRK